MSDLDKCLIFNWLEQMRGTIDAVLAQLCIRHDLTLLTTDNDFSGIATHTSLRIWKAAR